MALTKAHMRVHLRNAFKILSNEEKQRLIDYANSGLQICCSNATYANNGYGWPAVIAVVGSELAGKVINENSFGDGIEASIRNCVNRMNNVQRKDGYSNYLTALQTLGEAETRQAMKEISLHVWWWRR